MSRDRSSGRLGAKIAITVGVLALQACDAEDGHEPGAETQGAIGEGTPAAATAEAIVDAPPPTRLPRTADEVAAIHARVLTDLLGRSPARLELAADTVWRFEQDPSSLHGAWMVAETKPLRGCGVPGGTVTVRVPFTFELDLRAAPGETLLVVGTESKARRGTIDAELAERWTGTSISSRKSAVPVPLTRSTVFAPCP
jgi:hypothetical protein